MLLSFDLHGYAASKTDGIVTSEAIEAIAMEHHFTKYITKMPVEIFLRFYRTTNLGSDLMWQEKYVDATKAQGRAIIKGMENRTFYS